MGHVPELTDGTRVREPLTMLGSGVSLGEVAVDLFFFLSGWLLTASLARKPAAPGWLLARGARLYPGFLVATAISLLLVAPLAGASPGAVGNGWLCSLGWAALLMPPTAPGAFATLPYPSLNGALWTLGYEARCYLLLFGLSRAGLLARPLPVATAAIAALVTVAFAPWWFDGQGGNPLIWLIFLDPDAAARLAGCFLAGSAAYLARGRLRFSPASVSAAAALLAAGLASTRLGHLAAATAGGYLLLAFAYRAPRPWMKRVGRARDLSYGIYLYAWPLTSLLVLYAPGLGLAATGLLTAMGAAAMAWLSWTWVEAPPPGG